MHVDPSPSPFEALSLVLGGLRTGVAGWHRRLDRAVLMLCWGTISRLIGRFERLSARFVAGGVMTRAVVAGVSRAAPVGLVRVARVWPGRFGWLVRAVGWQAAGFGLQVAHQLARPEMVALLVASAQARRLLRPVCRMLAVDMRLLRPAGVVEVVRPARVRAEVAPVVVVEASRIPLPRGVLAWARAERRREAFQGRAALSEVLNKPIFDG